ncbi:MAG: beta-hydroxyacyl-ACP dehydratase [Planctomycetes bacterium]|nr:beta-hydroxyacyl-ACP dehydratase [Planctomycetota bacterium]
MEEVRKVNAQRFEMEQLDGIVHFNRAERWIVGMKNVRNDEFWVRGHIPGRPLMPGVVIVEAAAQLCTYCFRVALSLGDDIFLGFAGLNNVKFRGIVVPGDKLIVIAKNMDMRPRRAIFETQAVVGDRLVYEGEITGMPI